MSGEFPKVGQDAGGVEPSRGAEEFPGISPEESALVRDIAARLGGEEYSRGSAMYVLERSRRHWFSEGEREYAVRYALTADAICDESGVKIDYDSFESVYKGHTPFTSGRSPSAFPRTDPGRSLMAFMRDLARSMSLYELSFDRELFRSNAARRGCRFARDHAKRLVGLLEGERVRGGFQLSGELAGALRPIQSCVADLL